jgi:hypothetical protein
MKSGIEAIPSGGQVESVPPLAFHRCESDPFHRALSNSILCDRVSVWGSADKSRNHAAAAIRGPIGHKGVTLGEHVAATVCGPNAITDGVGKRCPCPARFAKHCENMRETMLANPLSK